MNTKTITDYIGSINLFLKDLSLNKERPSATFMRCSSVKQKPVSHKQRAVTCLSNLLIKQYKFHTFSAYFTRCNLFRKTKDFVKICETERDIKKKDINSSNIDC